MPEEQIWIPYCGAAPVPADWLGRWNLDPLLLFALLLAAIAAYRTGRSNGSGRFSGPAVALLCLLYISPFCALTSALFAARVAHHVVLVAIIAPLLALALPPRLAPVRGRLALWTIVQALVLWAWHSPGLYSAALSSDSIYWLMQLSLFGSAIAFWIAVRWASPLNAVAALLATMVQMGLLGALITFSAQPLYEPHFATSWSWGFSPLEDQQLGGLIMWAPAAAFYLVAALVIAGTWLRRETGLAAS